MVQVTSIQKWDTGFSGRIPNFESWYPSWILRKNINRYNKLFINLACSVCTEKYRTKVFLYKPRPTGSVCTKMTSVRYFSVQTSCSVNKKLIKIELKITLAWHLCQCMFRKVSQHSKTQSQTSSFLSWFLVEWVLWPMTWTHDGCHGHKIILKQCAWNTCKLPLDKMGCQKMK
jgi:hypothetical protein